MSMNFSDFIRQLGADPSSKDADFLRARESSPEFAQAAAEADRFEQRLQRAVNIAPPPNLVAELQALASDAGATGETSRSRPRWFAYAMAASVLLAVVVAGSLWRSGPQPTSLEQYVAMHYSHDGERLVAQGAGQTASNIEAILARFDVELTPEIARQVGLIQFCPTPDGVGAHLVLNTPDGPVTVIFIPGTTAKDGQWLSLDGMQGQFVQVPNGTAAVIGGNRELVDNAHNLVQFGFVARNTGA